MPKWVNGLKARMNHAITDVQGIRVGHAQDKKAKTGCTVVLCESGAIGGIDIGGFSPGSQQTEQLRPTMSNNAIHGILLTGGSAFGLEAANGVVQFLEERGFGLDVGVTTIPIVPTAVIFDLKVGNPHRRPDKAMGYQACLNASENGIDEGRIGAGCGAKVGKILGHKFAMNGGVGTCSEIIQQKITVGVLAVVNALGDIIEPSSGNIIAGAIGEKGDFVNAGNYIKNKKNGEFLPDENTTLIVIATDAHLTKSETNKIARMAQDGIARAIRPAHTAYDGDIIFVISTGDKRCDVSIIGTAAADLTAKAIIRGVQNSN